MLSEKNLDILIKNLSLGEYSSVMQDISNWEIKIDKVNKYVERCLTTDMKLDLYSVLITIKSMLEEEDNGN